jgi:hypothetical protein
MLRGKYPLSEVEWQIDEEWENCKIKASSERKIAIFLYIMELKSKRVDRELNIVYFIIIIECYIFRVMSKFITSPKMDRP